MATSYIEDRMVNNDITSRFTMTISKGKLTANSLSARRKGGVIAASFLVSNSSAVAKGDDIFTATINDANLRPVVTSTDGGYYGDRIISAGVGVNGSITVRNQGDTFPANTEVRINLLYMAKQAG